MSFEHTLVKDPAKWLIYGLMLLFIFSFTYIQLNGWKESVVFTLSVILAFLILAGIAVFLMWLVRRLTPDSWSYLWRQGLANLYRPNNQTNTLIVSIGLGTALITTVFFIQTLLLNRVTRSASGNQPNMVLFDIQSSQRQQLLDLATRFKLPVNGTVPIVNMRLEAVNNVTAEALEKDSTLGMQSWIFSREYRVTFRDSIIASEKITEGKWIGKRNGPTDPVYVSIEERYGKRNNIDIGDTMVFNVQGTIVSTIVGSMRVVDWNRVQTNFLGCISDWGIGKGSAIPCNDDTGAIG